MNTAPPTPERHTWQLYLHMTRPGFLLVTAIGCLIGLASAAACGCGFDTAKATATVVLAVLAHASANVLNDYFDSRNGADTANQQGMLPFSGGARFIQNGQVSERDTGRWSVLIYSNPSADRARARARECAGDQRPQRSWPVR